MAHSQPLGSTVVLLPIRQVSGQECVKRKPGRPKKVERPTICENAYNAALCAAREEASASDPLVVALNSRCPAVKVIHSAKVAMAEETAALGWERRQHEADGREIGQISSRRIDGLSKLAAIELELHKLGGPVLDPRGSRMQQLWGLFMDTVSEAARGTLPAAKAEDVIARLEQAAVGWEDRIDLR